jgi:hypothetical protein
MGPNDKPAAPFLDGLELPSGVVNTPYSAGLTAAGKVGDAVANGKLTFSIVNGSLPPGLSIGTTTPQTGVIEIWSPDATEVFKTDIAVRISGTPTMPGTYRFGVRGASGAGEENVCFGTKMYQIVITPS